MKTRPFSEVSFSVQLITRMALSAQITMARLDASQSQCSDVISRMLAEYACSLVELGAEGCIIQMDASLIPLAREVAAAFKQYYPEVEQANNRLAASSQPPGEQRAGLELILLDVSRKIAQKVFRLLRDFYEQGIIPGTAEGRPTRASFGAAELFNLPDSPN